MCIRDSSLVPHPTPADAIVVGRVDGRDDLLITARRTPAGIDRIRVRPRTGEDAFHLWLDEGGYQVDRVPAMGLEPGGCGVGAEHELVGPAFPAAPEARLKPRDRIEVVGPRPGTPSSPIMRSAGDGCVQVAQIGFDLDFELSLIHI